MCTAVKCLQIVNDETMYIQVSSSDDVFLNFETG